VEAATAQETERRTSYLELFFDLVFVFAITQVTSLMLAEPTAAGYAKSALVLAMVYWAWSGYAWATNAIDLGQPRLRLGYLAAMGATPAWATLSLSLPTGDAAWVDAFLDGFLALADRHRVALVGGDTTRGPLSVCVTVHGFVEAGRVLRRDGARPGDDVWVTGTLGDAAAALAQWRAGAEIDAGMRRRLDRPTPRVAFGQAIADLAHAGIDVSDGLLADLAHVCDASGVGAVVDVDALPASAALLAQFDIALRRVLQATGGDDYELCFTADPAGRDAILAVSRDIGVDAHRIGHVVAERGVVALADGATWTPPRTGYTHFD